MLYQGDAFLTRFATQFLEVTADIDYILVLTGTVSSAAVSIWETPDRGFDGSETVFEARFAHTSASMGTANYYFAAPGVVPVSGEEVGTLSFGDTLTASDFPAGDYVLTITDSTDPAIVLFQSRETTFAAANQYIVTSFDGEPKPFPNYVVRAIPAGIGATGVALNMTDARYPATVEFVNGSITLGTVDIYEDELLTSRIVADHAFRDISAEVALESGVNTFYYIDPANPGAGVLLEGTLNFADGLRGRAVAFGETGARILNPYAPDRRSIETSAKLQLYNAAFNFEFIDIYIVPAGETIENSGAALAGVSRGFAGTTIPLPEGSYDIYIADLGGSEAISAPVRIDVVRGDVLGGIIYDTVDPAVVDVVLIADSL